ncbi:MAG TPA: MBL fold metallo-hydrolase [Gaiellaceae bacterium]
MLRVGDYEIVSLLDADGSFATFREAFGVDSDESWTLPFHGYLVRRPGFAAVVDTGIGPEPREFLPGAGASLPDRLAEAGCSPESVELVLLTHLHVDHVGWNGLFPEARIVANARDFAYFERERGDGPYFQRHVAPFSLELVDDEVEVAPGLTLVPAYGHTPGHMTVRVESSGERAELLGDVAVHELQLADPGVEYEAEVDGPAAAALRRSLFPRLADDGVPVALGHLRPHGLGRIRRDGVGFAWIPLLV